MVRVHRAPCNARVRDCQSCGFGYADLKPTIPSAYPRGAMVVVAVLGLTVALVVASSTGSAGLAALAGAIHALAHLLATLGRGSSTAPSPRRCHYNMRSRRIRRRCIALALCRGRRTLPAVGRCAGLRCAAGQHCRPCQATRVNCCPTRRRAGMGGTTSNPSDTGESTSPTLRRTQTRPVTPAPSSEQPAWPRRGHGGGRHRASPSLAALAPPPRVGRFFFTGLTIPQPCIADARNGPGGPAGALEELL